MMAKKHYFLVKKSFVKEADFPIQDLWHRKDLQDLCPLLNSLSFSVTLYYFEPGNWNNLQYILHTNSLRRIWMEFIHTALKREMSLFITACVNFTSSTQKQNYNCNSLSIRRHEILCLRIYTHPWQITNPYKFQNLSSASPNSGGPKTCKTTQNMQC